MHEMFCGNRPHYWNYSPGSVKSGNYCLRCGLTEGQIDYVHKLEAVVGTLKPFDLAGTESWAQAIVNEWKRGERDHSAVKVAEKLLVILPDLRRALVDLEDGE